MESQTEVSLKLALIFVILHVIGWVYNAAIHFAEKKKYLEGYTSLAVAAGVSATLAPFVIFQNVQIWWIYAAFAASGSPMMIGAWWRHVTAREQDQQGMKNE